jgi:hypothetical protein
VSVAKSSRSLGGNLLSIAGLASWFHPFGSPHILSGRPKGAVTVPDQVVQGKQKKPCGLPRSGITVKDEALLLRGLLTGGTSRGKAVASRSGGISGVASVCRRRGWRSRARAESTATETRRQVGPSVPVRQAPDRLGTANIGVKSLAEDGVCGAAAARGKWSGRLCSAARRGDPSAFETSAGSA